MVTGKETRSLSQLGRQCIGTLASFLPADDRHRRWLRGVLVAGLSLRVLFILWMHTSHAGNALAFDSKSYIDPARAFLTSGRFETAPGSGIPMFVRTPGYPGFIAFIYQLFGWTGQRQLMLLLTQALLGAVVAAIAYVVTSRLWGEVPGIVAAAIVAFDPYQIRLSNWFMSEALFTFFAMVMVFCAYAALRPQARRTRLLACLGIALAAASLTRPTTYYFVVVPLGLCLLSSKRLGWRHAVTALVVLMVPTVLLVGGWQLRNAEVVGSSQISGTEARDLYYFRAPDTLSRRDGISFSDAQLQLHRQYPDLPLVANEYWTPPRGADQGAPFDRMAQRGLRVVLHNPVPTARNTVYWLGKELTDPGMTSMRLSRDTPLGSIPGSSILLLFGLFALYIAAGFGMLTALRRDAEARLAHVFAISLALWILVLSAGAAVSDGGQNGARFRAPVLPILAIFAAPVLVGLGRRVAAMLRSRELGSPPSADIARDAPAYPDTPPTK
jgi:4-amino-4-deoxy-L-arabinose transferase-like glycosyltransferase